MPSIADLVDAPSIAGLATPGVLAAGDALADAGAVRITIFGPLSVAARVDGPDRAATALAADGATLRWSCTCLPGRRGAFCAHLVATARATSQRSSARRP